MSEVDRIYQKYIGVFYEVDGGGTWIDLSAVRYALRAALREMAETQRPTPPSIDQRQYERLTAQIAMLNDWLAEYAADLYIDPATDTAEAMVAAADRLRGAVQRLTVNLAESEQQLDMLDAVVGRLDTYLVERAHAGEVPA